MTALCGKHVASFPLLLLIFLCSVLLSLATTHLLVFCVAFPCYCSSSCVLRCFRLLLLILWAIIPDSARYCSFCVLCCSTASLTDMFSVGISFGQIIPAYEVFLIAICNRRGYWNTHVYAQSVRHIDPTHCSTFI